jgi:hypothetical protein
MAVPPKLMISAGLAVAGLGLVGAGAGATFTAQVSTDTQISTGGVGLSLNDKTGSNLRLDVNGQNLSSHFAPISTDLRLKNTGTVDLASDFLSVTATGCDGGSGAALAQALDARVTDVTNGDIVVYDGALCSFASSLDGKGFITPPAHSGVGGQLPHPLGAGETILYRLVIQPHDAQQGLPTAAQTTSTSVSLIFSGFDY